MLYEPLRPVAQGVLRDSEGGCAHLAIPDASPWRTRPGKERHDGSRIPGRVAVVEVVAAGVVEVYGLLYQPETENARVEVHVLLWVVSDCGDVVYARKLYAN